MLQAVITDSAPVCTNETDTVPFGSRQQASQQLERVLRPRRRSAGRLQPNFCILVLAMQNLSRIPHPLAAVSRPASSLSESCASGVAVLGVLVRMSAAAAPAAPAACCSPAQHVSRVRNPE